MTEVIDPADFHKAQHENWAGSRVLDVAAGHGEPALTAARKAGPEGLVVALSTRAPRKLSSGKIRA